MCDELELLRGSPELQRLLGHYAAAAAADPEAWQDRLMHLEGVEPRELVRLHGLLLAAGWVEQNTGNTPVLRPGAVPCCYQVTPAGRRAARQARGVAAAGDEGEAVAAAADGPGAASDSGTAAPAPGRRDGRRARAATPKGFRAGTPGQPGQVAGVAVASPG
jgi:hypothetical protein